MSKIRYLTGEYRAAVLVSLILFGTSAFASVSMAESDAFYKAMKREDIAAMTEFVDQVSNANMRLDDGRTALMLAAKLGSSTVVKKLLQAGANINEENSNGGTALMYSAIRGDKATLMVLLENGAHVNVDAKFGWTALMVAAAKGHADLVQALLDHGADANVRDIYYWTPLMRSAFSGHAHTVSVLLEHSQTDIDAQDENNATALHHAATNGYIEIVELLLAHNASTTLTDRFGYVATDRALANKHISIASLLEKH